MIDEEHLEDVDICSFPNVRKPPSNIDSLRILEANPAITNALGYSFSEIFEVGEPFNKKDKKKVVSYDTVIDAFKEFANIDDKRIIESVVDVLCLLLHAIKRRKSSYGKSGSSANNGFTDFEDVIQSEFMSFVRPRQDSCTDGGSSQRGERIKVVAATSFESDMSPVKITNNTSMIAPAPGSKKSKILTSTPSESNVQYRSPSSHFTQATALQQLSILHFGTSFVQSNRLS